jgi:Tfp pilus assembly protein PilO
MTIGRTDKLWVGVGVGGAIAIILLAWNVLISPQASQTADLNSQTAAAQQQNTVLADTLSTLRAQNKNLAQYQATLAQDQAALPSASGMPDFLRELQAVGASTQVNISSLNVGVPVASAAVPAGVYSIAITLNASGAPNQLELFLGQLQSVQPRAVLISEAVLQSTTGANVTVAAGSASLRLTLAAFVALAR